MNTLTEHQVLALAVEAKDWPTISDLAETYQVNGRAIRKAVAAGDLVALRLNVLRVQPASFAAWLNARQP